MKKQIPQSVISMVSRRMKKGLNALQITDEINTMATVRKSGHTYTRTSIRTIMGNITRKWC